jgi:hypothetical protein
MRLLSADYFSFHTTGATRLFGRFCLIFGEKYFFLFKAA